MSLAYVCLLMMSNGLIGDSGLFGQIDMSNIIDQAHKIVAANGYASGVLPPEP